MGDKSDSDNWLSDGEDKKSQKQDNNKSKELRQNKQKSQSVKQQQIQKETHQNQNNDQRLDENKQHNQSCWMDDDHGENQAKQQNEGNKSQKGDISRLDRGDIRTNIQQNNRRDVRSNRYQGLKRDNQRYGNQIQNFAYRKDWRNEQSKKNDQNRYHNDQNRGNDRRNNNNGRYQNRDRDNNSNRYDNNDNRQRNKNQHNQRNDNVRKQQRGWQNKQKHQNQKCLIPNQNAITLPYQSIKLRGIQIRISYKKLLSQFHNFILIPFEDQNITLFPGTTINTQHNDLIKNRLNRKRQVWEGKEGAIIDLNKNTKQFDALFLLKLPNLKESLLQFLNIFNQINKKVNSIALPFLGNNQNIDQTSKNILSFLFQNAHKWKKGNVSILSVVVENPDHYISLKKVFHLQIEELMNNMS